MISQTQTLLFLNLFSYKYLERTRPTKSSADDSVGIDASEHEAEEDEDEYEDEPQQKNVTVPRNKSNTTATTNTRKYASIGRRTTTTTTTTVTTPETTTTTTSGTGAETAKANNNNSSNTVKINNVAATTPAPLSTQPDITTATATIINETTEPIESTINTNIQTTSTTNTHSPTPTPTPTPTTTPTTTPTVASTIQVPTTNSIDSLSLAEGINDMLELPLSTLPPAEDSSDEAQIPALDLKTNKLTEAATPTPTATETTTQPELVKTVNNDDKDDDDSDNQINNLDNEVTTRTTTATKTQSKYTTSRRRNTNRNRNNTAAATAAAAINDASPNVGNSPGLSRGDPSVNIIRNTYSGRRQPPQRTKQPELKTTELPLSPTNTDSLGGISSPRPFGYPRRRTRPTATKPQPITITTNRTVNNNDNDSDSEHKTQIDDVASVGKTRLSTVDRPKVSDNNSQELLDTSTNTPPPTTTKSNITTNVVDVDVAGNGGNILRHDVVSSPSLSTKDNDETLTKKSKYEWRGVQGNSRVPTGTVQLPNALDSNDKFSRRYAGKRLAIEDAEEEKNTTEEIAETTEATLEMKPTRRSYQSITRTSSHVDVDESQTLTSTSNDSTSSNSESSTSSKNQRTSTKVNLDEGVALGSVSAGKRNYQSITRNSSRGHGDEQIHYASIVRDNSGAHLTEGRSSSFMRKLDEVERAHITLPIRRGGLIAETSVEDENIAAEIIDDEPRGKTIAPASSGSSDDSNTAAELDSKELDNKDTSLRANLSTKDVEVAIGSDIEVSSTFSPLDNADETTIISLLEDDSNTSTTEQPITSTASTITTNAESKDAKEKLALEIIDGKDITTEQSTITNSKDKADHYSRFSNGTGNSKSKASSDTSSDSLPFQKSVSAELSESNSTLADTSRVSQKISNTETVRASTRRPFSRAETSTKQIATTTTETPETTKDVDADISSSTPLPKRRVLIRGNYRPRKEGDLSSLLAVDASKRVKYNHQEATRESLNKQERAEKVNSSTEISNSEDVNDTQEDKSDDGNSARLKLNSRTSHGAIRNRTSSQTESLGNGVTRTRTTYVRTLDAGKVVKRVHTKIVEEKPAEYEYIYDEVHEPAATTTPRTVTRNRGSAKFRSTDLSSLLALDFASKAQRSKKPQSTVTKTRRRLLKKPKETIESEKVEEFIYENDNDLEVPDSEAATPRTTKATTTRHPRTRPTRPSRRISTTERTPTTAETTFSPSDGAVDHEATTRRTGFRRPTSKATTRTTTVTPSTITSTTTEQPPPVTVTRRPVATTKSGVPTTTELPEETTTTSSSSTTTTTTIEPATASASTDNLRDLQKSFVKALNNLHANGQKSPPVETTPTPAANQIVSHDDQLSLPIYHRRKYYQYVKDSPITYIDKTPTPPTGNTVTVDIQRQIHDVFNVSDNGTTDNSLEADVDEDDSTDEDHRKAMEQAREINSELSHFLLKTPGSV